MPARTAQVPRRIGAAAWRAGRSVLWPAVLWFGCAAGALAQGPEQPGGAGQSQIIRRGPSFAGGIILVVVMSGAALFAVCRSSRRN